jgi:hypothetical protein
MRVACLISGQPRFNKSFELQLQHLKNNLEIDWFITTWKKSNHGDVSPILRDIDIDGAREYIGKRFLQGHRLVDIEVIDQPNTNHIEEKNYAKDGSQSRSHIYLMYLGIYMANQLKTKHEEKTSPYDLVIRTRPDVSLNQDINLIELMPFFEKNTNSIITPRNDRYGPGPTNDQFAIGTSNTINLYADAVNNLDEMSNMGVKYDPETLLYHHLKRSGINDHIGNFNVNLREHHYMKDNVRVPDWGIWG